MAIKLIYNKPQISVFEQIRLLKSEGLMFTDEENATHLLENISLFRMKSYLVPLRLSDKHTFKSGALFEDAYTLYKFDSELRKMVFSELEKIEVSIRTQLSLIASENSGIYWFVAPSNFSNKGEYLKLRNNICKELQRSDDDEIVRFRAIYSNPFPPAWMTSEVISFGTLSLLYRWLCPGHIRRKVARFYGLSDNVMESWLHSLVYVRNICAHHSRLWNKRLRINALVPRHTQRQFIAIPNDTKRVYYALSIILYFLQTINPKNTFSQRLNNLLTKYPSVDVVAMGFPSGWKDEPIWH